MDVKFFVDADFYVNVEREVLSGPRVLNLFVEVEFCLTLCGR